MHEINIENIGEKLNEFSSTGDNDRAVYRREREISKGFSLADARINRRSRKEENGILRI